MKPTTVLLGALLGICNTSVAQNTCQWAEKSRIAFTADTAQQPMPESKLVLVYQKSDTLYIPTWTQEKYLNIDNCTFSVTRDVLTGDVHISKISQDLPRIYLIDKNWQLYWAHKHDSSDGYISDGQHRWD